MNEIPYMKVRAASGYQTCPYESPLAEYPFLLSSQLSHLFSP